MDIKIYLQDLLSNKGNKQSDIKSWKKKHD